MLTEWQGKTSIQQVELSVPEAFLVLGYWIVLLHIVLSLPAFGSGVEILTFVYSAHDERCKDVFTVCLRSVSRVDRRKENRSCQIWNCFGDLSRNSWCPCYARNLSKQVERSPRIVAIIARKCTLLSLNASI